MKIWFKKFCKAIFSGIIGSSVALTLGLIALAGVKVLFVALKQTMFVTQNKLYAVLGIMVLSGFLYGATSFFQKNQYFKTFKVNWMAVSVDLFLAAVFALLLNLLLKVQFKTLLTTNSMWLIFGLLFVLFYTFSALITSLYKSKKKANHLSIIGAIATNPIVILFALWIFSIIVYTSIYLPCRVTIVDIDKNQYTMNTKNLEIQAGEHIVSLNGISVNSLEEIKRYVNGLDSTSQVSLETEKNIYNIRTYKVGDNRYMGLILRQDYCYTPWKKWQ